MFAKKKKDEPETRPEQAPETQERPTPETQDAPRPRHHEAAQPETRAAGDGDLVEIVVTHEDGLEGPAGTHLRRGDRVKVPSLEARAHLLARKAVLPEEWKRQQAGEG